MKTLLILMSLIALLFVVSQAYGPLFGGTEEQSYTVVERFGALEVRHYPRAVMATVEVPDTVHRSASGAGFRRLAGYIFGGNSAGEHIAMTAPVHMESGSGRMRMSFVMPAGRARDPLPDPQDDGVVVHAAGEEHLAVLRFGGFMREGNMADMERKLLAEVERNGLTPVGGVRFMGYDPPWQMIGRRNEVAVAVVWPKP